MQDQQVDLGAGQHPLLTVSRPGFHPQPCLCNVVPLPQSLPPPNLHVLRAQNEMNFSETKWVGGQRVDQILKECRRLTEDSECHLPPGGT